LNGLVAVIGMDFYPTRPHRPFSQWNQAMYLRRLLKEIRPEVTRYDLDQTAQARVDKCNLLLRAKNNQQKEDLQLRSKDEGDVSGKAICMNLQGIRYKGVATGDNFTFVRRIAASRRL
jgi:hypothetical protein